MSDGEATSQSLLRYALIAAGSSKRLVDLLGITPGELSAYLAGERALPGRVFSKAVDIVLGKQAE